MSLGERNIVVLDVGKTLAKLSLWQPDGTLVARKTRANEAVKSGTYASLDAAGVETWAAEVLREFAQLNDVGAIIPVSHGAALAIVSEGQLITAPMDYEESIPAALRAEYERRRDCFEETGSPSLPDGLNLGAQLFRLVSLQPDIFGGGAMIMPYAQYWSWLLSGIAASEVTSLGCHSDLWRPLSATPSRLATTEGWADRFAPMASAGDVLGCITTDWASKTGLSPDVRVHCGLHDSNAALLAARAFPEIEQKESTVVSTGTWFVAMRSPQSAQAVDISKLAAMRDCLVNVDAFGKPVPSARFMGGREIESLIGLDTRRVDIKPDQPRLVAAVPAVLASQAMVLPTFAPGTGPFPHGRGQWINMPADACERRAAVSLYAALIANVSLDLIGARERILIEGRFAEAEVFTRALARLRPDTIVYVSNAHNDVSFGALRLLLPDLKPSADLIVVDPLEVDLGPYQQQWLREVERMDEAE